MTKKAKPEGKKFDTGKVRFTLFPVETLHPILEVLEHGAKKYGEHNWRSLDNAKDRYVDALHRHIVDYLSGARVDKDSGLRVTAHIACNAIFLLAFDLKERLPDVNER